MSLTTVLLALLIGIIYPVYIGLTYKKVNSNIKLDDKYRLKDYKQTILLFWILSILVLLNYFAFEQPAINLNPKINLLNIGLGLLVLVFAFIQYKSSKVDEEKAQSIEEKIAPIYPYLPKTKKELNWFSLLSVSAGICEEIIFRLFLFEFLKESTHLIIAFILANLVFALTHLGSGKSNLISSFILGLLFSAIYVLTDNIWIAVLLHMVIDINAGVLGYNINKMKKTNN